jgi:hypothetical protein
MAVACAAHMPCTIHMVPCLRFVRGSCGSVARVHVSAIAFALPSYAGGSLLVHRFVVGNVVVALIPLGVLRLPARNECLRSHRLPHALSQSGRCVMHVVFDRAMYVDCVVVMWPMSMQCLLPSDAFIYSLALPCSIIMLLIAGKCNGRRHRQRYNDCYSCRPVCNASTVAKLDVIVWHAWRVVAVCFPSDT